MNKIQKQFRKKEKWNNSPVRKWWSKNGYIVARVTFFYIWIPIWAYEKIKKTRYKNLKYSDSTTKKYLDKVMPKLVAYYEENPNIILFHDTNDFGGIRFNWDLNSYWMEKKFRKETRYFAKFHCKVEEYIIYDYHIDGYEKMILENWTDWNKAKEKFDWYDTPYNSGYARGVVFYK